MTKAETKVCSSSPGTAANCQKRRGGAGGAEAALDVQSLELQASCSYFVPRPRIVALRYGNPGKPMPLTHRLVKVFSVFPLPQRGGWSGAEGLVHPCE